MNDYVIPFRYNETTNDELGAILDYLNEQPGRAPVTKTDAIRYAIAVAAMGIRSERIEIENTLTK